MAAPAKEYSLLLVLVTSDADEEVCEKIHEEGPACLLDFLQECNHDHADVGHLMEEKFELCGDSIHVDSQDFTFTNEYDRQSAIDMVNYVKSLDEVPDEFDESQFKFFDEANRTQAHNMIEFGRGTFCESCSEVFMFTLDATDSSPTDDLTSKVSTLTV